MCRCCFIMQPARFRCYDPCSVDDALGLPTDWGNEARLLAGRQTLGPMLNPRVISPNAIIDINRLAALAYRQSTPDGLAIGAMTRQAALEDDPAMRSLRPLVAAALPYIPQRVIRNRGTAGGTLARAAILPTARVRSSIDDTGVSSCCTFFARGSRWACSTSILKHRSCGRGRARRLTIEWI